MVCRNLAILLPEPALTTEPLQPTNRGRKNSLCSAWI